MSSVTFTDDAQTALDTALADARARHNLYADVEHMLLGLLSIQAAPLTQMLSDGQRAALRERAERELGQIRPDPLEQVDGLATDLRQVMLNAGGEAENLGHSTVNSGHLLLAMLGHPSPVQSWLHEADVLDIDTMRQQVKQHTPRGRGNGRVVEVTPKRPKKQDAQQDAPDNNPALMPLIYIGIAVLGVLAYLAIAQPGAIISFGVVLVIWVFSLTLHEFSHAIVAYWGGDHTVKDKGYLTFNPLKYTHPLLSIFMPLMFLALGGIGLPGGAVYIEKHRLRGPWWATAVSLAGPASNLLMAGVLALPFALGLLEVPNIQQFFFFGSPEDVRLEAALAFSILLQFTAVLLNLLPIPPLDGFQALAPWMPQHVVQQAFSFGFLPILLLFFMFSMPAFANPFWGQVEQMMDWVAVPYWLAVEGLDMFRFWN